MNKNNKCELVEIEGIPVSAAIQRQMRKWDDIGTVKGLEDDELLTENELERMAFKQLWGYILDLPVRCPSGWIKPQYDEYLDDYDLGAFGTVDFERLHPFNSARKANYKADKIQEELENEIIIISIISERIESKAKYLVLKYLKMGIIDLDHIENLDMHAMARHCLKAWRLQKEIRSLRSFSRKNWNILST